MTSANEQQLLAVILEDAITSDLHEEDALDFLEDHRIAYGSHSRQYLITRAWQHGWRPA
jgi:hypothetical protein